MISRESFSSSSSPSPLSKNSSGSSLSLALPRSQFQDTPRTTVAKLLGERLCRPAAENRYSSSLCRVAYQNTNILAGGVAFAFVLVFREFCYQSQFTLRFFNSYYFKAFRYPNPPWDGTSGWVAFSCSAAAAADAP